MESQSELALLSSTILLCTILHLLHRHLAHLQRSLCLGSFHYSPKYKRVTRLKVSSVIIPYIQQYPAELAMRTLSACLASSCRALDDESIPSSRSPIIPNCLSVSPFNTLVCTRQETNAIRENIIK